MVSDKDQTNQINFRVQVHGHYADAGEVASMVASTMASTETGLDMVMTGHSLGRNKLEHLLATGINMGQLVSSLAACVKCLPGNIYQTFA